MPRKPRVPSYRLHRSSGQAIVTLTDRHTRRRRDVLLGEHGTQASHKLYDRVIADWIAAGRVLDRATVPDVPDVPTAPAALSIARLLLDFWKDEKARHGATDETLTPNLYTVRVGLRVCRSVCGADPVDSFGPKKLSAVRDVLIEQGLGRHTITRHIKNIVRAFRWGVSQERVSPEQLTALQAVRNLGRGERGVPQEKKRHPVDRPRVDAIRPHVSPQVWAMVELAWLTGMRRSEVVSMRPIDIETTGEVWVYRPVSHKTAHRGHDRVIDLGPLAQDVLRPFLSRDLRSPVFSPREALKARKAALATEGKQGRPEQPSPEPKTDRRLGDAYTPAAVTRAIARACDAAGIERWTFHQLRHTHATIVRKEYGIEAASARLGHRGVDVTLRYAEADRETSREVARAIG
ncbi:MAG: site-specific integrase [Planctomycetota bacterium]